MYFNVFTFGKPCYSGKTFRNCISPFAYLSGKKIFVLIMIITKTSKFGNKKY